MAPTKLTDRAEPTVIPRAHAPTRSRLPSILRIPILVGLNLGINLALWSAVSNFLNPELGQISKVPREDDDLSLYSPGARILMRVLTTWMTWYFNYDFLDVTALTVLTQAPYVYLLSTYYEISTLTIAAYVHIEVLSYAIPTYLLRPRSIVHKQNAPLCNRFLLNSVQVQTSGALLAIGVYVTVLWAGLKTGFITDYLITYFDIPTVETAHLETPLTIGWKVWTAGVAARAFLLNPSIAAQPQSGAETPVEEFNPATADLTQTLKANTWYFSKRTRTLIQQTFILNAFLFANNMQKCMTLNGTEVSGAAGYASIWVFANSIIALWYAWVGDTSPNYEPL